MEAVPDFDQIVEAYEGRIVRYLTGLLGHADLAQDLTQETFLRIHRGLAELRSPEARTAWIYRIASNLAIDHLRGRTSREEAQTVSLDAEFVGKEGAEPAVATEDLSPEDRLEQEEMAECLRHYIHHLSGDYRICLILRDLEGLSEEAVAEILGCSIGAVKVRTHRARKKLREALRAGCCFYLDARGVLRCEPAADPEKRKG